MKGSIKQILLSPIVKPQVFFLLMLIVGIGLFLYSLTLPYFIDEVAISKLDAAGSEMSRAEYWKQRAELSTAKRTLMDIASGIAIFAFTIFLFLLTNEIKQWRDFKKVEALPAGTIFWGTIAVCIMLYVGVWWYYIYRLQRGDCPPFADTITIAAGMESIGVVILSVAILVFVSLFLIKLNLPAKLFARASKYNILLVFFETIFAIALLLNLCAILFFVLEGNHFSIPVSLSFTYILLSLRAGQMTNK